MTPHPKPSPRPPKARTRIRRSPVKRGKKVKRFAQLRDPGLCAFVRTLGCVIAWECAGRTEVAHLKSRGAGGADRNNVIPLCTKHHREQHQIGIQSFGDRYFAFPNYLARHAVWVTLEYDRSRA